MKYRNKALIKSIITAVIMFMAILAPLTIAAGKTIGSGAAGGSPGVTGRGGASSSQYGYLAYIVDKNGNLASEVAFLYPSSKPMPSYYDTAYMYTKIGEHSADFSQPIDSSYPKPYVVDSNDNNIGQGDRLYTKLTTEDSTGTSGAAYLINDVWGGTAAETFSNGGQYLIMEAVWWIETLSLGGDLDDYYLAATSTGWAQLLDDYGYSEHHWYYNLTNGIYPISCTFNRAVTIGGTTLNPATVDNYIFLSNSGTMILPHSYIYSPNTASGMVVAWCEPKNQTTNDESKSSPHKPADESTGTYQIVKSYVDKLENADGSVTYTDAGTYVKTDSAAEISIEDESSNTGYTLMQWYATDSSDTSVTSVSNNSLVWDSNVPREVIVCLLAGRSNLPYFMLSLCV